MRGLLTISLLFVPQHIVGFVVPGHHFDVSIVKSKPQTHGFCRSIRTRRRGAEDVSNEDLNTNEAKEESSQASERKSLQIERLKIQAERLQLKSEQLRLEAMQESVALAKEKLADSERKQLLEAKAKKEKEKKEQEKKEQEKKEVEVEAVAAVEPSSVPGFTDTKSTDITNIGDVVITTPSGGYTLRNEILKIFEQEGYTSEEGNTFLTRAMADMEKIAEKTDSKFPMNIMKTVFSGNRKSWKAKPLMLESSIDAWLDFKESPMMDAVVNEWLKNFKEFLKDTDRKVITEFKFEGEDLDNLNKILTLLSMMSLVGVFATGAEGDVDFDAESKKVELSIWVNSDLQSDEELTEVELEQLRNYVFTDDLLAENRELQRSLESKKLRVGRMINARAPKPKEMVVVDGAAAVSMIGRTEVPKVYEEAQRRLNAIGLGDKVRLFVKNWLSEDDFNEEDMPSEKAIMENKLSMGDVVNIVWDDAREREPYLIIAVSSKAIPREPFGGIWLSVALLAGAIWTLTGLGHDSYPPGTDFNDTRILPILVLATQFVHDLGHLIVAALLNLPVYQDVRFLPSPLLGLMGSSLRLKGYPKTKTELFDYSAVGPVAGALFSGALFIYGLQETASASAEALAHFPHIPTALLQSSFLVGGITNFVLPGLSLTAPDVAAAQISMSPVAMAGALGLLSNALHCMPLEGTDGSVALSSILGRGFPSGLKEVVQSVAGKLLELGAGILVLLQLFNVYNSEVGLASAFVPLYIFFLQSKPLPVLEEHKPVGGYRSAIVFFMQIFWILALLPLPLENFLGETVSTVGDAVSSFSVI